jgi:hypothetical protein
MVVWLPQNLKGHDSKGKCKNFASSLFKNGNLLRQRKNPDRLCMSNTPRGLDFFASLHLTILEQAANFGFFNSHRGGRHEH